MKNVVIIVISCLFVTSTAFGQAKMTKEEKLKAQIVALDTEAWQAFKDRNVKWFETNTAESFLSITGSGVSNKADVLKATPTECNVKSFSLDDFEFVMLNKKTVHLTYVAMQDGYCGDTRLAPKVRGSVIYTKQGGKWLETIYVELPIE